MVFSTSNRTLLSNTGHTFEHNIVYEIIILWKIKFLRFDTILKFTGNNNNETLVLEL